MLFTAAALEIVFLERRCGANRADKYGDTRDLFLDHQMKSREFCASYGISFRRRVKDIWLEKCAADSMSLDIVC